MPFFYLYFFDKSRTFLLYKKRTRDFRVPNEFIIYILPLKILNAI